MKTSLLKGFPTLSKIARRKKWRGRRWNGNEEDLEEMGVGCEGIDERTKSSSKTTLF